MSKLFLPDDLKSQPKPKLLQLETHNNTIGEANSIYNNNTIIGEANNIKMRFLARWNELGGRQHKRPNTKVYQQSLKELGKLVRGTFFNDKPGFHASAYVDYRFTEQEWEKALENFNLAARNTAYYPVDKKSCQSVSLPDFLYNAYVKGPASKFLHYLENAPQRFKDKRAAAQCKYPDLRTSLIKVYDRELLGDIGYEPGREDWRDFTEAANRLGEWYDRHKQRISVSLMPITLAQYLLNSIFGGMSDANRHRVMPYWLKSDQSVERQLPKYLFKEGLLVKKATHSRGDCVGMQVEA
jgi:hypothetical protein